MQTISLSSFRVAPGKRNIIAIAILLAVALTPVFAQNTGIGTPPFGSFTSGTPYDVINNQNLNVHFVMSLESVATRKSTFTFYANNDSQIWKPVNSAWVPVTDASGNHTWGWFIGNPNGSLSRNLATNGTCLPDNSNAILRYTESNFVFTDPQGTQHAFPSVSVSRDCVNGQIVISGTTTGYANDASGYFLNTQAGALDGSNIPVGVVIGPGGIQYQNIASSTAASQPVIVDPNGNFVSTGPSSVFNGTTTTPWMDTSGTNLQVVHYSTGGYDFEGAGGANDIQAGVGFTSIPIATNFGCPGIAEYTGTAQVVSSIALANGQQFTFTYEQTPGNPNTYTGRLKSVTISTGGSYQYDYSGANNDGINCADGTTMHLTRTVNDGTTNRNWVFSRAGSTTTVTVPKLSYDSSANDTVHTFDSNGHEVSTATYQGSAVSGTLLQTVNRTWAANGTPASLVTILEDGHTQSETDTAYDSNGLLQGTSNYDFGNPSHGPLLRTTTFTYLTDSNYTGGSNSRNIINLTSEVKIQDGSGNIQRRTRFSYDEPGTITSCPPNAPQHLDSAYGCTFQFRGNLTSVLSYKDPVTPANPIVTGLTYDFFGNVLTKSMAGVQQLQNALSSTTQYSFPDTVTVGPPSGPQLTTTYTYNTQRGQVATARDPNGQLTQFSYDTGGRVTTVIRPDSVALSTTYDDTNHKVTYTSPIDASHSNVRIEASDALGNLSTVTGQDGSGNTISIVKSQYDETGRLFQVSNPYTGTSPSFFSTTQFDALGRPTLAKLPDGEQTTYSYSLQTTTTTDPTGKQTKKKNDALGRVVELDVPGGNSAAATPGSGSGIVNGTELTAGGVAGVSGTGSVTINGSERHKFTNPCAPAHQNCPVTYYDTGNISLTANGHTDQVTWGGGASETALTVAQRLADAIRANSPYVDYTSVVSNSSTSATIYLTARTVGVSTDYSISATSSDTFTSQFPTGVSFAPTTSGPALTNGVDPVAPTYDSGNVSITVNGFNAQVPYQQGSTGATLASALVNVFNTPGSGSPVNASLSGSTISLTANSPGSATNYSLSSSSSSNLPGTFPTPSFSIAISGPSLAGGTDGGGPSMSTPVATTYTYNVADQITNITTGTQTRTYVYDNVGRKTSVSVPELNGGVIATQYDDLGRITQSTDARGVVITYTYDTLNRVTGVSYNVGATGVPATPSVSYTYGTSAAALNNGKLITMTDGAGSETYTYDNMGRKIRCDKIINGTTYTTQYQYNSAGEITQIQYPSGRQVNPSYDSIGRLSGVSDTMNSVNSTYASSFSYNVAQQVTQFTYGNGVVANFGYSSDGRQQLNSLQYSKAGQTLFGLNYVYTQNGGNNGQVTRSIDLVDNGRSTTYLYDALGRLAQAYTAGSTNFPNWDLAFSYDQYGNRTDETPEADTSANATVPSNHVLFNSNPQNNRITTGVYAYDANGNMTNDGVNTLIYNAANEVVSTDSGAAAYQYDGYGMRVQKCGSSCAASSTVYIYSNGSLIAEYDNGAVPASPSREYINVGSRLAKIEGGAVLYYHPDQLSMRALTDASGNKIGERGAFPYGEQWYASGTSTKFQFTGYERDLNETGNDYAMARYYINRLGRFSSPDPLDNLSNSFAYVNNDPVNATDPLGLWCLGEGRCATHDEGFLGINEFDLMQIPITTETWGAIFIGPQDLGTVAFPGGTMSFRILSGFGFYTQTLGTAMDWLSMLIGPGDDQKNPNDKDKPCPSSKSSLVNLLPHGGGVLFSGSAEAGVGQTGATAQGSVSLAGNNLFVDNNGNVSTGSFVSGAAVAYSGDHVAAAPAQTKVSPPSVVGAYAGVGGYFFLTNAQSAYQESGPFATVNLNIGVGPKLSFTFSYDPSSKIWLFGVNPPPLGYGYGVSGSVVTTSTHVFDLKNNGCH